MLPATRFLFFAFYDSQGYGGDILKPPAQGNSENHTKTQKYALKFRNVKAHGTYSPVTYTSKEKTCFGRLINSHLRAISSKFAT
jgi:hypothetical protein